jgi:RING finger protein 113A
MPNVLVSCFRSTSLSTSTIATTTLFLTRTMSSSQAVNVPFFKKKRSRPMTARQRSASPEAASGFTASSSKTTVVLPTRKTVGNLLTAGTKRTASQREDVAEDEDTRREGISVNWGAAGSSHVDAAREILAGDEAEAVLAKRQRTEVGEPELLADDGMYHGQKAYTSHIRKNKEVPKAMRTGPQRASGSTIRTVTIVDYQPDVCKDYKGAS